jgi:RNA polymerase sigma-70 factor (ECF subfamily)
MSDLSTPLSSGELMARWRAGDEEAAATLWRRYARRLIALARRRISGRLNRHVDPEDVVQSAYRSFFVGARSDRYVLQHSGDLWRLLVAITLHKVQHQVKHHLAMKRAGGQTQSLEGEGQRLSLHPRVLAQEPSPEDAAALTDELTRVLAELEPWQRVLITFRLQGYQIEEIADMARCHERTVRRVLERVRKLLRQRCTEYSSN